MADNVVVAVRSRPLNSKEKQLECQDILDFSAEASGGLTLKGDDRYPTFSYSFDHAYSPAVGQVDVYREVGAPLVRKVMDGFNCTLFAYGQTSSGKTHTMMGPDTARAFEDAASNGTEAGVIPRLTAELLAETRKLQESAGSSGEDLHIEDAAREYHDKWRAEQQANQRWKKMEEGFSAWAANISKPILEKMHRYATEHDAFPAPDQDVAENEEGGPKAFHWIDINQPYEHLPEEWKEKNRVSFLTRPGAV